MRTIITAIALLTPCAAYAQTYSELMQEVLQDKQGLYADVVAPQPILPVVPVVPMYPPNAIPRNPYGTGYSIVTTERSQPDYIQRYLGIKDATTRTTTTSVVPNNAWGQPIRPINPFWP
jgi:hypothetical protein